MVRGINVTTGETMLEKVGDEQAYFTTGEHELKVRTGVDIRILRDDYRSKLLARAVKENAFTDTSGIDRLYFRNEDYPPLLRECNDAPAMLYKLGSHDLCAPHPVAIVGTRHCTAYGADFTARFVEELSAKIEGLSIVSGLAYGIDVAAHRAALKTNTPTVAVLAHPLNTIYPAEHRSVAAQIVQQGGALVTEYPTETPTHRVNFLERNRIIAGLCQATIVVESDIKGGAMMTASMGMAYSREVFAVPGRVYDRYSRGCNRLIMTNKAAMITSADDFIDMMGWSCRPTEGTQQELPLQLTDDQNRILQFIEENPNVTANEISRELEQPYAQFSEILFQLEMAQLIMPLPGGKYAALNTTL